MSRPAAKLAAAAASPPTAIALVRSSSLPMLVHKELERMILAGDLAAGGKLNEAKVAELLGVSRGPVREAFRALEESGLVRLEKNRGVFVRQISLKEADEIYELRATLDEWAGRRVAQTADPAQIRELKTLVDRMERVAAKNDVDAYYPLNLAFHDRLIECTGNAKLLSTYRRLVNELNLFRRQTLAHGSTLATSAREHRDIIDKIAARNPAAAGKALYDHATASRVRMHRSRGTPDNEPSRELAVIPSRKSKPPRKLAVTADA